MVEESAFDPDCLDVGGGAEGEDSGEGFFGVFGVVEGYRQGRAIGGAEQLGVEVLANAEVAHLGEVEGFGAGGRGEVEQVGGGERSALIAEELLAEVRLEALLEQGEAGAGTHVGAQSDANAVLQVPVQREESTPQGRVAGGAVGDGRAPGAEHLELDVRWVDVVREN